MSERVNWFVWKFQYTCTCRYFQQYLFWLLFAATKLILTKVIAYALICSIVICRDRQVSTKIINSLFRSFSPLCFASLFRSQCEHSLKRPYYWYGWRYFHGFNFFTGFIQSVACRCNWNVIWIESMKEILWVLIRFFWVLLRIRAKNFLWSQNLSYFIVWNKVTHKTRAKIFIFITSFCFRPSAFGTICDIYFK